MEKNTGTIFPGNFKEQHQIFRLCGGLFWSDEKRLTLSGGPLAPPMRISALHLKKKNTRWETMEMMFFFSLKDINEVERILTVRNYLQDSFIDKIEAPLLPITRPIIPWGTSKTERISSSGAFPSFTRLSEKHVKPI